jgi:hypothetical protein
MPKEMFGNENLIVTTGYSKPDVNKPLHFTNEEIKLKKRISTLSIRLLQIWSFDFTAWEVDHMF